MRVLRLHNSKVLGHDHAHGVAEALPTTATAAASAPGYGGGPHGPRGRRSPGIAAGRVDEQQQSADVAEVCLLQLAIIRAARTCYFAHEDGCSKALPFSRLQGPSRRTTAASPGPIPTRRFPVRTRRRGEHMRRRYTAPPRLGMLMLMDMDMAMFKLPSPSPGGGPARTTNCRRCGSCQGCTHEALV
jgi:hypothetical protein